ncbi:MAG TPA: hypothetical protein VN791_02955 [Acidimicrobiales bacterium]|jgi:hypothetical protein|nr:hypothetical protein [Acidimicrobiales bacterium]
MIATASARLRVPAVMAIGGSAIALGSLVGAGWKSGLGVEVVTVMATIGYYVLGGRDSDAGALFGSRPDERQAGIAMRATTSTGNVLCVVVLGGFVVTTALGRDVWPFALMSVVGGITFVVALVYYRHH